MALLSVGTNWHQQWTVSVCRDRKSFFPSSR